MLFEGRMITIGDTGLITLQGTKIPQAKKKKKKDPTCHATTKPVATITEPEPHNKDLTQPNE